MNPSQQKFHDFILDRIQPGKEDQAESIMAESFRHQDDGSFSPEYMGQVQATLMSLLRPECVADLIQAGNQMRTQMDQGN
ncbi:MAG: hypothetical protein FWF43_01535 [Propionibacteriaceae bacterium]|nr:hypothetical protein [Propionibacteriaceae bacterium]